MPRAGRRGRAGARGLSGVRPEVLSRRPSDAGVLRQRATTISACASCSTRWPPGRRRRARSRPSRAPIEPTEPKVAGFVFKVQANMDPNHRDRIAFLRLCSGKFRRGMKLTQMGTGKVAVGQFADPVLRPRARDRRRGLARRHHRHPQPRRAARRRHADRGRDAQDHRHPQLRAGNPAPRAAGGSDEVQAAQARARGPRGGGRDPGVPPRDRRRSHRGRGRRAAARRAEDPGRGRVPGQDRPRARAVRDRALDLGRQQGRPRGLHGRQPRRHVRGPRRLAGLPGAQRLGAGLHRREVARRSKFSDIRERS